MIIKYLSPAGLSKLISKMKAAFSEKNHNHQLSDLSGTVPVNKGGTGATEAARARTNLGVTPQNIGAMPTGGGTFTGNIAVSKTDPYVSLENTGTNNKFGFHVYGTEGGKGTLALYDHIKAKHVFNVYSYSEKVTFEWPVDLLHALAIESGGTGANNAAGARNNLSVPELRSGVVIVGNQKGIGTGVSAGQYWQLWNLQNGSTYPAGLVPSENGTQYLGQNGYRIKAVYANDYPCGTWNGNAIAVAKGGTGATDAAGARANLDITPANIGAAPTSHTHSAGNITSGVISIERGGTGASDAATARANLGALATSGGPITGYLQFGTMSNGLEWFTANGTQFHLRPYTPDNLFQITVKGPGTDNTEIGAFGISYKGEVSLAVPLGIAEGGTGATSAATARANLAVPELRNSVVIVGNQKGIGTDVTAGQYWQFWNLQDGDAYPAAFCPSSNGRQLLGQNSYRIKAVYANDYPCGTWNGNAIAVAKGGTGATSAAGARANLGIGVADTASGSITYNSAGQQVNFGKTLSKVPIVICIQNGGDFANYKVGNITRTGFTISASATGTTWQYVALCV
mgnify:CR=1 FL=1